MPECDQVSSVSARAEMEQDLISVVDSSDNHITLRVPPYSTGLVLQEDLYLALEQTLGAVRYDRFMDMTEEELQKKYHYFGTADRTLTFEVIETGLSDIPSYLLIRDGWLVSESDDVRKSTVTETAVIELPPSYEPYVDLIPPKFPASSSP